MASLFGKLLRLSGAFYAAGGIRATKTRPQRPRPPGRRTLGRPQLPVPPERAASSSSWSTQLGLAGDRRLVATASHGPRPVRPAPAGRFDEAESSLSGVLDRFRLDEPGRDGDRGIARGWVRPSPSPPPQAGADVVIGARRVERARGAPPPPSRAIGRKALVVPTRRHLGGRLPAAGRAGRRRPSARLDGLVNSAGVATAVPGLQRVARAIPRRSRRSTCMGAYWMAQAAAEAMTAGGSIVNVSSILGLASAELPQAAYATSKAGVLGLTRDLAAQWSATPIDPGQRPGARVLRVGDDATSAPGLPRDAGRRGHPWAGSAGPRRSPPPLCSSSPTLRAS